MRSHTGARNPELHCLKLGKRNTKFFHQTTVARRRRSIETILKNNQGDWIDNEEELRKLAKEFYENLYKAGNCIPIDEGKFDFPTLNHNDHKSVNKKVSKPEIKATLFQMDGLKALGHDGLPPCFSKKKKKKKLGYNKKHSSQLYVVNF